MRARDGAQQLWLRSATILLVSMLAYPTQAQQAADAPVATALRVSTPPLLDGVLDDPCWQEAPVQKGFRQRFPNDGAEPSFPTEFMIAFDDSAIYVGLRAYDDPTLIDAPLARRDSGGNSDWLTVSLGPLADRRTAFEFIVNPAGVKQDGLEFDDTQYDAAWDPVWEVATHIDELGWTAEMAIPLSQLRYESDSVEAWDLQVSRQIARLNESSRWSWSPRETPGYVSHFGYLRGIAQLAPHNTFSLLPYVRASLSSLEHHDGNPFEDSPSLEGTFGIDVSAPLGSAFTLGMTANPDFGQVEGDPAQLNLSAFETYLNERRPFFRDGANALSFGGPELYYSRRLGRAPRGDAEGAWVNAPRETPIFFAARLSGTSDGWTLGVLDAITDEVYAEVLDDEQRSEQVLVEPLANTFVARVQKSLRGGATTLGGMLTALHRGELETNPLPTQAYTVGFDWRHRWDENRWAFKGFVATSLVHGAAEAIEALQRSSARYYQRPDAPHLGVDPNRESLEGLAATVTVAREGGEHWLGSVSAETISPGFEINDVGYGSRADLLRASASLTYRELEPSEHLQDWDVAASTSTSFSYGLESLKSTGGLEAYFKFPSYWSVWFGADFETSGRCTNCTWGGPSLYHPFATSAWAGANSDARDDLRADLNTWVWGQPEADTWAFGINGNLSYRLASSLELRLTPSYNYLADDWAWVDSGDGNGIFAALEQHTLSTALRLDWTFTPELSLQGWVQTFVAVGAYSSFLWVTHPEADSYEGTFDDLGISSRKDGGLVLEHPSSSTQFELSEPDFTSVALRSTVVLRWEFDPGSTLFLVWQQRRAGAGGHPRFDFGRDFGGLFTGESDTEHVVMLKLTAWLGG